ncbi:S9 family peptidase [Corallincola spongiicola]|uniref:S9 family peptidase n=1 Tax=Corallincola spongiicola TaxID=2520508 RepID=A0ABY1WTH0_9GAMM|nr:S9 family peptidase [Corallincola spongiicola]TAA48041.1 S9 family peptidase [Corallincola spongiicola]
MRCFAALVSFCLLAQSHLLFAAPLETLQLEDVFALEYASDPQLSRSGEQVIFVRNFMDIEKDRKRSNLWVANIASGELRPLTTGLFNDRSPRLSPDGKRLAFISNRGGSTQLYMRWQDTGQIAVLSQLPEGPTNLTWSPDGASLLFTAFVPRQEKPLVALPGKPRTADWAPPAKVVSSTFYRFDGAGYLPAGNQQIFMMSADGGSAIQLTQAQYDHDGPLTFSPDVKTIYFSAVPDAEKAPLNSELFALSLNNGKVKPLTDRVGPDAHPALSPDGKYIAYVGFDDRKVIYQNRQLYLLNLATGNSRVLTADLDRSVAAPVWSDNGKHLYFQYDDQGNTYIGRTDRNGRFKQVVSDVGGLSLGRPYAGGQFTVKGRQIAFTTTDGLSPAEIAVVNYRGGKAKRITHLNKTLLSRKQLATIEEIRYPSSADGLEIQGWIAYPPNFDATKKYPLMLEIHGGPVANYGARFAAEIQLFAAAGYVVLYVNPRGSDSYGEVFANYIHHNYPSEDYDDLISGVDAVIAKGFVDPEQLYVTGGSGGGTLTAWIVGHTDRFKAAVVAKPVINWYSFSLTADAYPFFTQYWFDSLPWDDMEAYMKRSPISYVGNVKTPTMLLTGESDYRTPISETEQYYQALKLAGVDTAMVRIPGAGHGIAARPSNLMSKVAHILWWFEQYGGPSSKRLSDPSDEG